MLGIVVPRDTTSRRLEPVESAVPEHGVAVIGVVGVKVLDVGLPCAHEVQRRQLEREKLGEPDDALDHIDLFDEAAALARLAVGYNAHLARLGAVVALDDGPCRAHLDIGLELLAPDDALGVDGNRPRVRNLGQRLRIGCCVDLSAL